MKKLKLKKFMSLFILIFILTNQLPLHVGATNTSGDLFLIGNSTYSDISQNRSGNGWFWNATNFTLTLDGYNEGPIFFIPSAQSSKTLHIVVKNNNSLSYDMIPTTYPSNGRTDFAALLVEKCNVHISGGGTLNTKASGQGAAYSLCVSKNATIENITLNCVGVHQSFACENIVVKNSTLNLDCPIGYWCISSLFENSTVNFKNTHSNAEQSECFVSGGKHTFKNCSVDVLVGARPSTSTPIQATLFAGMATYVFDNTVFKVRQGQHNHADNAITLFSLGYPTNVGNSITISNNSRFELTDCVDHAFRAFEINVSNSSITGACSKNLFSSILLNITNSNLDVTGVGNTSTDNALIIGQDINILNSNIKGRSKGNIWGDGILAYSEYEKNISLTDTKLDVEGKGNTFSGSYSLNYANPERWTVFLDGTKSELPVNSPKMNLRHNKVVIKYTGEVNVPQAGDNEPSKEPTNQSGDEVTTNNDSKETMENDTTSKKTDKNDLKEPVENNMTSKKTDKKDKGLILALLILITLVLGALGSVTYIYFKRKTRNQPRN